MPRGRPRRIDLRPARRQRRQADRAAARRRPHHAGGRSTACAPTSPSTRRRRRSGRHSVVRSAPRDAAGRNGRTAGGQGRAAQLPLLRQSPEVPPVRQHLRREVGGRQPRGGGARQHPAAAAGAAPVRRRRRRRHRAGARHARHARALPDDAVLRRRQGDQPRGHPADARQAARPFLRAPGDRGRAHQHLLLGSAVAARHCRRARRRAWSGTRCRSPETRRIISRSRSPSCSRSSARTGRRRRARRPAIRSTSGRWCSSSTARTTASCSIRSSRGSAAPRPTTIWSSPRSPIGRACRRSSRRSG